MKCYKYKVYVYVIFVWYNICSTEQLYIHRYNEHCLLSYVIVNNTYSSLILTKNVLDRNYIRK